MMFHVVKVKFCKNNGCLMAVKHIFGAKDSKGALLKFISIMRDLDIEPIEIRIFMVSDLMEANGMFEEENWKEVVE